MAAPPARRVLGMRTRSFNKTGFDWLIDLRSKKINEGKKMVNYPHPREILSHMYDDVLVPALETKDCQLDNFVVTGGTHGATSDEKFVKLTIFCLQ